MQRSFSYILLITWFFLFWSCNPQYVITNTQSTNRAVSDSIVQPDSRLVSIYLPYKEFLDKDMSRVIGRTREEMVKNRPESNLTNFLADLLLTEGKKIAVELEQNFTPDISFFNYGGIRTFLPEGEVTVGKIFELMPFENELVFLKLSGEQVAQFLNQVAEKGGDSVGGVRMNISGNSAVNIEISEKPLDENAFYWLVTNDYVAAGGDDLEVFTQRSDFVVSDKKIRDVIIAHLEELTEKGLEISAKTDGRISYE